MTPEQFAQVRAIFDELVALSPDDQPARLRALTGSDTALRREVESLLAQNKGPSPVDAPVQVPNTVLRFAVPLSPPNGIEDNARKITMRGPAKGTPVGRRIGGYAIIRLLGEGGMGAVYEAQQHRPQRRVALKLLRADLVSPAAMRRFILEAEVLARLEHPGIARVYEAGPAEDGGIGPPQPFFVMELVNGRPLTTHAREQRLSVRDRLALLARVCDAVQHAHQKGVIHRDLKPTNVLVTADGHPKVLDFGIARVVGAAVLGETTVNTAHTESGQLIGTLAYMSPEQASGQGHLVDTRGDVYALGVMAYELLADRLPIPVAGRPMHEAVRAIALEEPERLSSALRTLRGDIETIVAKAMAKDPARRYASAAELAADIRRYLSAEPIVARPNSAWYQLSRFAQRNRLLVGSIIAIVAALLTAVVGTSIGLSRASRAELAANAKEADARAQGRLADARAVEAQRRAAENAVLLAGDLTKRGVALDDKGDRTAVLYYAQALRAVADYPDLQAAHRVRLGVRLSDWPTRLRAVLGGTAIASVDLSSDARRVLTVDVAGRVRVWDCETGIPLNDGVRTGGEGVVAARFLPNGDALLIQDHQGVSLWDADAVTRRAGPARCGDSDQLSIASALLRSDGGGLLVFNDESVQVYLVGSSELSAHQIATGSGLLGAWWDGRNVVTLHEDKSREEFSWQRRTWNPRTGHYAGPSVSGTANGKLAAIAMTPHGLRTLVSNGVAARYRLGPGVAGFGKPLSPLGGQPIAGLDLSDLFSSEGGGIKDVLEIFRDRNMFRDREVLSSNQLVDHSSNHTHTSLVPGKLVVTALFTADSNRVFVVNRDPKDRGGERGFRVNVYDAASGQAVISDQAIPSARLAAVSRSGEHVLLYEGSENAPEVRLWDVISAKTVGPPVADVAEAAFSPDASAFIVCGADGSLRRYDVKLGGALTTKIFGTPARGLVLQSSDGQVLVTRGPGTTALLWSARSTVTTANGAEQNNATLRQSMVRVPAVATGWASVTGDGSRLITRDKDGRGTLWDLEAGGTIGAQGDLGVIVHAWFGADGRRFLTVPPADGPLSNDRPGDVVDIRAADTGRLIAGSVPLPPARYGRNLFEAPYVHFADTVTLHHPIELSMGPQAPTSQPAAPVAASRSTEAFVLWTGSDDVVRVPLPPEFVAKLGTGHVMGCTPDGTRLLFVELRGKLDAPIWSLIDVATGRKLSTYKGGVEATLDNTAQSVEMIMAGAPVISPDGRAWAGSRLFMWGDGMSRAAGWGLVRSTDAAGSLIGVMHAPLSPRKKIKELSNSDAMALARFSPDGRRVITQTEGVWRTWDASTGKPLSLPFSLKDAKVVACQSLAILAAGSAQGFQVWDAVSGLPLTPRIGTDGYIGALALTPKGDCLSVVVVPTSTGNADAGASPKEQWVERLAYDLSPDSRSIDELTGLAQFTSGRRFDEAGGTVDLDAAAIEELWKAVRPKRSEIRQRTTSVRAVTRPATSPSSTNQTPPAASNWAPRPIIDGSRRRFYDAKVVDVAGLVAMGQAMVSHSPADLGVAAALFDGNPETLLRTRQVNPAVITLSFTDAVTVQKFRLMPSAGPHEWTVESADSLADLDARSGSFRLLLPPSKLDGDVYTEATIPVPVTTNCLRLTVRRLGSDDHVHIREWEVVRW